MGVTPQQFEQMKSRLQSGRRAVEPLLPTAHRSRANATPQIVLGIDPSLRGTGYGVICVGKTESRALAHGTITCPPKWERSRCLLKILQTIRDVVKEFQPTVCAVEGLIYANNFQIALKIGEARGAALAAVAEAGLDIYEIAPRKVKQAIVGYGAAQKLAVAKMVQRRLNLEQLPEPDAADALALAIVHAQEHGKFSLTALKKV